MAEMKQLNVRLPGGFGQGWKILAANLGISQAALAYDAMRLFCGIQNKNAEKRKAVAVKIAAEVKFLKKAPDSYKEEASKRSKKKMVRGTGFEPVTPTVSIWSPSLVPC